MVGIIDCQNVHISEEFCNWIKKEHTNILLIFVPINCINKFQVVNVILQKPLKHAFKVHFNSWTFTIIKDQIVNGQELEVDFKMSDQKLRICN
jgi:hypothetical protein